MTESRPLLAVSACLLGQPVRYDGGHTRTPFVASTLAEFVDFLPLCPEEGAGMSTPREAVRLVRVPSEDGLRMLGNQSGEDWTERMHDYSARTLVEVADREPCGFILKRGSPSCGVFRVPRYNEKGKKFQERGPGLFAQSVLDSFPHLPVEEEGRMNDAGLRHHFLVRVFAQHRLQELRRNAKSRKDVMEFQRREKLLLMAHSPAKQKELGRLVAQDSGELDELLDDYIGLFGRAMSERVHRGRVVNVLQHMAGYLRRDIDDADARELHREIDRFGSGNRHSAAVWMLLRHHLRRQKVDYLLDQTVLEPYPEILLETDPDPQLELTDRSR